MNISINFKNIDIDSEREFVQSCIEKEDYINYISDSTIIEDLDIIYNENSMIGIANTKIIKENGLLVSTPTIYLVQRLTKLTSFIMAELIYYLFEIKNVELLKIPILSNNYHMKNMMNRLKITFNGTYKEIKFIDGRYIDMHFYSMTSKDYRKIKKQFINRYV